MRLLYIATLITVVLHSVPIYHVYLSTTRVSDGFVIGGNDQRPPPSVNITIYSTGGTASAVADSPTNTTHYRAGAVHIDDILREIKGSWSTYANVVSHQLMSLDSVDMDSSHIITISRKIAEELKKPCVTAVLLITGTSNVAELAAALGITVKSNKGVVITGAFRPHTAYDADGPQNIIDSITLAATPGWSEEYHEVAIAIHGDILLPWGLYKDDDQFKTGFGSRIGRIEGSKAYFHNIPRRYSPEKFDISGLSPEDPLPEVVIITVYSGFDVKLMRMAVLGGARGIILLVYDDGYIPTRAGQEIEDLINGYDIVVIGVNYSPSGTVIYERVNGVIPGGDWNSRQVRQFLQYHIWQGTDREEIAKSIMRQTFIKTDRYAK